MSPLLYPRPTAEDPEIERTMNLYENKFGVELTRTEAKDILERLMQFIYLTEIEDALHPLRSEIE